MYTVDKKQKAIDLINIFIIIILSYSVIYYFSTIGMDVYHDRFMFKIALDLAHGKVMYRDTYSSMEFYIWQNLGVIKV